MTNDRDNLVPEPPLNDPYFGNVAKPLPPKPQPWDAEAARQAEQQAQIVCQHCRVTGKIQSRMTSVKRGVSGGKLAAALLTGGLSLLFVGLSRDEMVRQMSCQNCGMTWAVPFGFN